MMPDPQAASVADLDTMSTAIYDALMGMIEPELTTNSIPLLQQKYRSETSQEKAARAARYQEAYRKYDIVYAQWVQAFQSEVKLYRRTALLSAEEKSRKEEAAALDQLVSSMNTPST